MNIISLSNVEREAVVRLDSDELVALCNILFHETKANPANIMAYKLYDNFMIARDLSQYGHIDAICLEKIIKCREKVKEGCNND